MDYDGLSLFVYFLKTIADLDLFVIKLLFHNMGDCTPCVRTAPDNGTAESLHKNTKFVGFPSISSQLANSAICKHVSGKNILSTPLI